jgi:hypothetical protein
MYGCLPIQYIESLEENRELLMAVNMLCHM